MYYKNIPKKYQIYNKNIQNVYDTFSVLVGLCLKNSENIIKGGNQKKMKIAWTFFKCM